MDTQKQIAEIYKRETASYDEKLATREILARDAIEKENLFNLEPFNEQIRKDWQDSLDILYIWCGSDWDQVNFYIENWREKIGN